MLAICRAITAQMQPQFCPALRGSSANGGLAGPRSAPGWPPALMGPLQLISPWQASSSCCSFFWFCGSLMLLAMLTSGMHLVLTSPHASLLCALVTAVFPGSLSCVIESTIYSDSSQRACLATVGSAQYQCHGVSSPPLPCACSTTGSRLSANAPTLLSHIRCVNLSRALRCKTHSNAVHAV